MEKNYKVSIIVPALDEEENIEATIQGVLFAFEKLNINGQIILVNDGSTDQTVAISNYYAEKYSFIDLINHETPQGLGSAYWDGVKAAKGDIITWVGGSYECDPYEILRYLPLMEHVDIVAPFLFNINVKSPVREGLVDGFSQNRQYEFWH